MKKYIYTMAVMLIICSVIIGLQQREINILNATVEATLKDYKDSEVEHLKTLTKIDSLIRKKIDWYENERTELYKQITLNHKMLNRILVEF